MKGLSETRNATDQKRRDAWDQRRSHTNRLMNKWSAGCTKGSVGVVIGSKHRKTRMYHSSRWPWGTSAGEAAKRKLVTVYSHPAPSQTHTPGGHDWIAPCRGSITTFSAYSLPRTPETPTIACLHNCVHCHKYIGSQVTPCPAVARKHPNQW